MKCEFSVYFYCFKATKMKNNDLFYVYIVYNKKREVSIILINIQELLNIFLFYYLI